MTKNSSRHVTQLLMAWTQGEQQALDNLVPMVHSELRRLAKRYMQDERAGHTLQPSALVNEAYLRLVDADSVRWQKSVVRGLFNSLPSCTSSGRDS